MIKNRLPLSFIDQWLKDDVNVGPYLWPHNKTARRSTEECTFNDSWPHMAPPSHSTLAREVSLC